MVNSPYTRMKYLRICKNYFKAIYKPPNFNFGPKKFSVYILNKTRLNSGQRKKSGLFKPASAYTLYLFHSGQGDMIEAHTSNKASFVACWDTENIFQHFWKVFHWSFTQYCRFLRKQLIPGFIKVWKGLTWINLSVQSTFPVICSHSSCYRETIICTALISKHLLIFVFLLLGELQ